MKGKLGKRLNASSPQICHNYVTESTAGTLRAIDVVCLTPNKNRMGVDK